jgi:hypothetical protein
MEKGPAAAQIRERIGWSAASTELCDAMIVSRVTLYSLRAIERVLF